MSTVAKKKSRRKAEKMRASRRVNDVFLKMLERKLDTPIQDKETKRTKRTRGTADEDRSQQIVDALVQAAIGGDVRAARAIREIVEGTDGGKPPRIDLEVLFDQRLSVKETLHRIYEAYKRP